MYRFFGENGTLFVEGEVEGIQAPARTLMQELAKAAFRKSGKKEVVKKVLEIAAILGCHKYGSDQCYIGPLQLCMIDAAHNLQYRDDSGICNLNAYPFYLDLYRGEVGLSGKCSFPAFTYETEITWQGGLPLHVRCRVDFTPSKAILLKKSKND